MTVLQQANRCFVAKDYSQATELYLRHAVECPGEAAQAYVGVAECCLRSNVIQEPVPVAPGVALVSQCDLKNAEHYFRLALQADPKHLKALWELSQILPEKSEERKELLERSIAVQPASFNLLALGDYYRSRLKDYERAYELYIRAQECNPRDKTTYMRLSDICRRAGRSDEAKEWTSRWKEIAATRKRFDANGEPVQQPSPRPS